MRLVVWLLCIAVTAADLPTESEVQAIFDEVGRIANLAPKRPVKVDRITREQLREYLNGRIQKMVKPAEIRADELTLKWLGFAPADFDLKKTTVDLITEQAAAYYDYKTRKLVMLENPIGEFDPGVLAHELAHALADQHFKIGRFMDDGAKTDDAAMARMAVVEGQAQWLMTAYELRKRSKVDLTEHPDLLPAWKSTDADASFRYPVLEKTPFYMRVTLLFPYWEGGRFQQALIAKDGIAALRAVFTRPPQSTQHILHPEVYFEGRIPDKTQLAKVKLRGYKELSSGVLGELDHLVAFKINKRSNAEELAADWRGGAYKLLESKVHCCVLLYASDWKDEASAEKAKVAWAEHVERKAVRGRLQISRTGRTLQAIEGAPE